MTGAEHYVEAERLLAAWAKSVAHLPQERSASSKQDECEARKAQTWGPTFLAAAQAHATLALAAATVQDVDYFDATSAVSA